MTLSSGASGYNYPKWLVLQLLEKCNLRCKMCYEWGKEGSYFVKDSLAELDWPVVRKVIEECSVAKPYLGLFGGEPLMYSHIEELLTLIREKDLTLDIPTNGTLVGDLADLLVKTTPRRLWISLDGPETINDSQRGKGVYRKVTKGIERLFDLRQKAGQEYPKIGITILVTAFNYSYVEELFLKCLDMGMIDHISVEFQLYATIEQYEQYREVLAREFGVSEAPCARGIVWDPADFASIDYGLLAEQIRNVRTFCETRGIYFVAYPKTVDKENYRSFFTADWNSMSDKTKLCSFPWMYAEVSALGDVTCCHTFYDLTIGNIYSESIASMWSGERLSSIRKYLRRQSFPICTACSRYYADPVKK